MKTKLLFLLLFTAIVANSQTRQPFSNIGKKVKVVTLTDGKYDEFFDENPLQRVGSSVINVKTRKITKMEISQAEIDELENAQASRFLSVDPMFRGFAWNSPYAYAENDVIRSIDLDGLEKAIVISYNAAGKIKKSFEGSYEKLQTVDNKFAAPIVDQIVGKNKQHSQFLNIQNTGLRTETNKSLKSTDVTYIQQYAFQHDYTNEDGDIIRESGTFEVPIYTIEGTKIWEPATYIVLHKVTSAIFTRLINGASILRGVTIVEGESQNATVQKLLRWTKVTGGKFEEAAISTRAFTKKIGQKAVGELKSLGFTKDDFLNYKKIYENTIKDFKKVGKNTSVQEARLESTNKILSLWKD